jgi:peptide/nickel transport system substrate-binding protein
MTLFASSSAAARPGFSGSAGGRTIVRGIALIAILAISGCASTTTSGPPSSATETGAPASAGVASAEVPGSPSPEAACQPGGTLVMARDKEPDSLNPMRSASGNGAIFAAMQIYERLIEQSPASKDPVPGLATSWEAAADGLSYTFHLRPSTFSDGTPVTAEDVKFSLDRFRDEDVNLTAGFLAANIKDVVIVDPSTVRIDMQQVDGSVLAALTLMEASILPQKAVTDLGEDQFGQAPVGSGPFMVKSWAPGQTLELARNPHYAVDGKPYLDGVIFQYVKDDNARILKAQSGEAQVVQSIPISQAATIENLPGYTLQSEPLLAQDNVWLNHSWDNNGAKTLGDKLVRQALNYATSKEDINNLVFGGLATISNTGTTVTQFWDPSIPPYPYDVDKAKELLSQSSSPNGFELPMVILAGDGVAQQTAELIQSEWADIGVVVDIQPLDEAVLSNRFNALDYAALITSATTVTSDTPDDSELASIMYDWGTDWKSFFSDYKSEAASKLVHDAVATTDLDQRRALYSELQKLTLDDAISVPLVIAPSVTAVSNDVQGFKTLPAGWWLLQDVCLTQ